MLTAGTKPGPYEVMSSLGAGGMGQVYRVRDTKLRREAALKILPPLFAADPDRRTHPAVPTMSPQTQATTRRQACRPRCAEPNQSRHELDRRFRARDIEVTTDTLCARLAT